MDRKLLDLLVCPRTHQPLDLLDARRLAQINASVAEGRLKRVDGSAQTDPLREALITRDGKTAYRVDDGIPVLLIDEGLSVQGVVQS